MNRVLAYLFRFAVIIGGYLVASLAASAFLNILLLGAFGFIGGAAPAGAMDSLIFSIPFVALFAAYFGFIPSAFAILAGEIFSKRDWLFYALSGAVVSLIVIGLGRSAGDEADGGLADTNFLLALVGAGMCGGIGYWLVAGRTAGSWRPAPVEGPTSPAP